MQLEDILRMRESDERIRLYEIEQKQTQLVKELQQVINNKTLTPSTRTNHKLEQAIKLLKD